MGRAALHGWGLPNFPAEDLTMSAPVHGTRDMIKGMSPTLVGGTFVFGSTRDTRLAGQCRTKALAEKALHALIELQQSDDSC